MVARRVSGGDAASGEQQARQAAAWQASSGGDAAVANEQWRRIGKN
jgi:hypothetical protein